jgi:hypothetical protein
VVLLVPLDGAEVVPDDPRGLSPIVFVVARDRCALDVVALCRGSGMCQACRYATVTV